MYREFDAVEYEKIHTFLKKKKYHTAYLKLQEFLKRYPNDVLAITTYIALLTRFGKFQEAEVEFRKLGPINHLYEGHRYPLWNEYLKYCIHTGQYKEAYQVFLENEAFLKSKNYPHLPGIKVFLKSRLGLLHPGEVNLYRKGYLFSQMLSYDQARAIEHIQRHSFDEHKTNYFYPDINLEEVYQVVSQHLGKAPKWHNHTISSMVIFEVEGDCVGVCEHHSTHYIAVEVLAVTNQIITIYPCECTETIQYPVIHLTRAQKKVETVSQIDKFNQRYAKTLARKK